MTIPLDDIPMALDRGTGWSFLRDAGRVVRVGDAYYVSHHDEVEQVLRDPATYSSKAAFDALGSPLPLVPISYDPPEHTRYRRILQPFFSPRALQAVLPDLQVQADALVDGVRGRAEVDVVEALAVPYPSQVFLTLFGLPLADRERLIRWKDVVIALAGTTTGGGPDPEKLGPALELFGYLTEALQAKRTDPGPDVLSQLLTGDEPLTDEEALGLSFLFVLAGLDTVTASIGFAFHHLARHDELRRRIVADPSTIPAFVEEVVRLEPPAPFLPRVTTRDVELAGTPVPKGSMVLACVGGANRDGTEGRGDPDGFDLDRAVNRHLGFGGGAHRCLGSHLARMELALVLEKWHAAFPEYHLRPGFTAAMPWPAQTFKLDSLPLVIG